MCFIDFAGFAPAVEINVPYLFNDILTERLFCGISKNEDFFMEIWMLGLFFSLMFIALSKEKTEDEMITQIRLQSMSFALWCTTIMFILETLFIFGFAYVYCLGASLYIFLILSILRFRYIFHKLNKIEK